MVVSTSTKLVVIIVFVLYTAALLVVGWLYKRKLDKQKGEFTDNFYTGGRAMGALLVAMMVAAGICSAGTFVGSPSSAVNMHKITRSPNCRLYKNENRAVLFEVSCRFLQKTDIF